LVITLNQKYSI